MGICAIASWLTQGTAPPEVRAMRDVRRALSGILLATANVSSTPDDVKLIAQKHGLRSELTAVVRARAQGMPHDLYSVSALLSPEGYLLRASEIRQLTDTDAADESNVALSQTKLLYSLAPAEPTRLGFIDLSGQDAPPEWPWLAKLQDRLTNLQETGRWRGLRRATLVLGTPDPKESYAFDGENLLLAANSRAIVLKNTLTTGQDADSFQIQAQERALPPRLLNWSVDRLRSISWVGDERVQLLKAIAMKLLNRVTGVHLPQSSDMAEIRRELGTVSVPARTPPEIRQAPSQAPGATSDFPPPPMQPLVLPALEGEGAWRSLDRDPFIKRNPGAASPFATAFIRTDQDLPMSEVYITLWDPRQIALSAVSGTDEPHSATGLTGSGLIPRSRVERVVAAFNGAFLSRHGRFGMKSDGQLLIPPKPFAATVAELPGGVTGFGTWPARLTEVPADMLSFRQNLTPLIVDGSINPYRRHFWGGTPEGWEDDARSVRSGLCMTHEHFIGYFYGNALDPKHLARAMQQARCVYGIHLDMNPGHVGLEFYHVERGGQLPLLGRPLEPEWEAHGPVPDLPGFEFQGRRMLRYMSLMQFPRYLRRQTRDFFYLSLKHILPGANLEPASELGEALPNEGVWAGTEDPKGAWPPAIVRTKIRISSISPKVIAGAFTLDPKLLQVSRETDAPEEPLAVLRTPTQPFLGGSSLWWVDARFVVSQTPPPGHTVQWLCSGYRLEDPRLEMASAALGVSSEGMLFYLELEGRAELARGEISDFMKRQRVDSMLLLPRPMGILLGAPKSLARGVILILRRKNTTVERLFPDTPVVPEREWAPLQTRRTPNVAGNPTLDLQ